MAEKLGYLAGRGGGEAATVQRGDRGGERGPFRWFLPAAPLRRSKYPAGSSGDRGGDRGRLPDTCFQGEGEGEGEGEGQGEGQGQG